jgi:2-keto-4-pentenoate hydratase/2-oxohepta-3-ene-1,7-dioic acid hydratase in catechol pathway
VEDLAGDEAGAVRREERDRVRNLSRPSEPLRGDERFERLPVVTRVEVRPGQVGFYVAGGDGVDRDTVGRRAAGLPRPEVGDWSHPVHKGIVFFQNVDAIIGPDDAIVYPEGLTKELDYELELELAIVIGRSGKFFGPDEAADYIAGYTVFNDITARDIQRREMQSGVFSFSKSIDTFCPIGPWIVTKEEVPDVHALAMELRVNGEVRQRGSTAQLLISIPHLVAYHSAQGYSAGDILTTGTISGVAAVQPNPFDFYLQPGDRIEAEIEGVGVLRNQVVPWSAAHDTPPYSTDLYSGS